MGMTAEAGLKRRKYPQLTQRERKLASNRARQEEMGIDVWRAKRREYVRRHKEKHPDRVKAGDRRRALRRDFNISVEEYDALFEQQGGRCKFCSAEPNGKMLAVDHDHRTGAVRGLLCGPCNMALGVLEDHLQEVMSYVQST